MFAALPQAGAIVVGSLTINALGEGTLVLDRDLAFEANSDFTTQATVAFVSLETDFAADPGAFESSAYAGLSLAFAGSVTHADSSNHIHYFQNALNARPAKALLLEFDTNSTSVQTGDTITVSGGTYTGLTFLSDPPAGFLPLNITLDDSSLNLLRQDYSAYDVSVVPEPGHTAGVLALLGLALALRSRS